MFIILMLILLMLALRFPYARQAQTVTAQEFEQILGSGNVAEAVISPNPQTPSGYVTVTLANGQTVRQNVSDVKDAEQLLKDNSIDYSMEDVPQENTLLTVVMPFMLSIVVVVVIVTMMNRGAAGGGSNARMMKQIMPTLHNGTNVPYTDKYLKLKRQQTRSETFLKQFHLPATAMPNTAMAAKFVAESGDPSKAAIASAETAALYGLEVLVPSINTDGDNTTRFIVLSREKPTVGNRFSLLFTLDNKPGKLAEVIQVIGRFGYDMESIKSRPLPHVPFDYYFYVELVGDPSADETAALLRELDHTCRTVRLLGVYTK